jgi:hypothetical protein
MRKSVVFLGVLCLVLLTHTASADPYAFGFSNFTAGNNLDINGTMYYNTDSGWVTNTGVHDGGNQNYFSGYVDCGAYCANFFSFDLATLDPGVTSASLTVDAYGVTNIGIFDIYGTALTPAEVNSAFSYTNLGVYNGIVDAPVIGSLLIGPGNSYSNITVGLNGAGLAWLNANAGGSVVVGGAYYSPAPVPEPGALMLFATTLVGIAGTTLRRRKRAMR